LKCKKKDSRGSNIR